MTIKNFKIKESIEDEQAAGVRIIYIVFLVMTHILERALM